VLRDRVRDARTAQAGRACLNAALDGKSLDRLAALDPEGEEFLEKAAERLRLSARAIVRVRRLARTVADLEGLAAVGRPHLAEAVAFRLRADG